MNNSQITPLDYFAGQILSGLLASGYSIQVAIRNSYPSAQAMLEARKEYIK